MKVTGLLWLLIATAPCAAVAGGLADADSAELNQLAKGLADLTAVDLGNCEYEYADFGAGYQALIGSHESVQLARLIEHHAIEVNTPEHVEHNPTHAQCIDALDKAKAKFAANAGLIRRLSATIPEAEKSEEP